MVAPGKNGRTFFDQYTHGLTTADFQKLFTRDTPEAYRYFARGIDHQAIAAKPWPKRWFIHARLLFTAFTLRLSPARRLLYGFAVVSVLVGMLKLFRDIGPERFWLFPFPQVLVLLPRWEAGAMWLFLGF